MLCRRSFCSRQHYRLGDDVVQESKALEFAFAVACATFTEFVSILRNDFVFVLLREA